MDKKEVQEEDMKVLCKRTTFMGDKIQWKKGNWYEMVEVSPQEREGGIRARVESELPIHNGNMWLYLKEKNFARTFITLEEHREDKLNIVLDEKSDYMEIGRCEYDICWKGRCKEDALEGERFCEEHLGIKCHRKDCGRQSEGDCHSYNGSFVCGAPMCSDHKHAH